MLIVVEKKPILYQIITTSIYTQIEISYKKILQVNGSL